jgi:hypothetical protein
MEAVVGLRLRRPRTRSAELGASVKARCRDGSDGLILSISYLILETDNIRSPRTTTA